MTKTMRVLCGVFGVVAALAATAPAVSAASLQVAPVLVVIPAPGATATVTLRNEGLKTLNAQVRVYRWSQVNGQDHLEPANDVVASPPTISLTSRTDYNVRVVRLARTPVLREETYRLVIDELPDANRERNGTVAVLVRHSIPVFFQPADQNGSSLKWSSRVDKGQLLISVQNTGDRRVRVSKMQVSDGRNTAQFGDGLVGYALAGSTIVWSRPAPQGFSTGPVTIVAQGDQGPINVKTTASAAR